jgi:hypothetical protein
LPGAECRKCGACCVAISISSPVPGMPHGKPAGVPCGHLAPDNLCGLFRMRERPDVCLMFQPSADVCGRTRDEALKLIAAMEAATRPDE